VAVNEGEGAAHDGGRGVEEFDGGVGGGDVLCVHSMTSLVECGMRNAECGMMMGASVVDLPILSFM